MKYFEIIEEKKVQLSPQFKAWFGASKVVDKKGNPLRVYHGTTNSFRKFETDDGFRPIFFSTNPSMASGYATTTTSGGNVMPVYLRVLKPFDYRNEIDFQVGMDFFYRYGAYIDSWEIRSIKIALYGVENIEDDDNPDINEDELTEEEWERGLREGMYPVLECHEFLEYIRKRGYDAIVTFEVNSINYGVFSPKQIKSALTNTGNYSDSENIDESIKPSIPSLVRKAMGGERPDYWAYGGRCYEFQEKLYNILKKNGYKPYKTESMWWANGDFKRFKKPIGYAESSMLCDGNNNHAWIFCDGKCYDSLNPNGADRPVEMKFFRGKLDRYRPDSDDEIHWANKKDFGTVYDSKSDMFIKPKKIKKIKENEHNIDAYHGTSEDFDAFAYDKNPSGSSGSREGPLGFWFSDNPEVANQFATWSARGSHGENVIPVKLKIKHPLVVKSYNEIRDIVDQFTEFKKNYQMGGRQIRMIGDKIDYEAARKWLKSQGYDGIILPDTMTDSPDSITTTTQYVVFDPSQIRSRFAKFDPDKINSDIITDSKILESIDFYPYVAKNHKEHGKIFDFVFPKEWYRETLNDPYSDQDEEEIPNPEYKPELNLNMSKRNAQIVMDALGIHSNHGEYDTMPIDYFINIARAWLRHSIGHREKGFEPTQTKTDEELYQEASDEVHDADMTLLKKQIKLQVEREVRSRRADAPDDVIQKLVTMRLRSKISDMIGALYKQKLDQRGPMVYDGGLRDGYVNEQILKMVKIAEKGKQMGATHVGFV